ncbi:MAG: transposase [Opitutales bacterium]|nr:transposase [Opitutales bacterium]
MEYAESERGRRLPVKSRRFPRARVPEGEVGHYHVISRVNGRARMLTADRREVFRDLLRRVAGFCGVEVLTFCFMENHFHLLVRVPGAVGELTDDEVLRRAALLYGDGKGRQPLDLETVRWALAKGGETRGKIRELLLGRMGSLPMFVKILKQRFSVRFNRETGRVGTLWEGPFKSVLVEPSRRMLAVVGAYIDLNPVRAGIVEDPKDYRFSGYGEAVGKGRPGEHPLLRCLVNLDALLADGAEGNCQDDARLDREAREYRKLLYVKAVVGSPSNKVRVEEGRLREVLAKKGGLSTAELLRCRVRYFTDGLILGGRAYIERMRQNQPLTASSAKRSPREMRGGDWGGLCSARDLQKGVIS